MFTDAFACREPISFPPKFVSSLRTQHNKHTSVRIWYDEARTQDDTSANFCENILWHGWEWKECQTTLLRIIRPLYECNTILTNQRRSSWQCGEIYVIRQLCAFDIVRIATTVERCIWELILPYRINVSRIYCELKVFTTTTMCTTFIKHNKTIS